MESAASLMNDAIPSGHHHTNSTAFQHNDGNMNHPEILLDEDFRSFADGPFSPDVGPHTEYHYRKEAEPKSGWVTACFGTGGAGSAWHIKTIDGKRGMYQSISNRHAHTHPMVSAGDFLWTDYSVEVYIFPKKACLCGLIFRYHNNRRWAYSCHQDLLKVHCWMYLH